jgi:endonuclease YncB( thermonuclease family)
MIIVTALRTANLRKSARACGEGVSTLDLGTVLIAQGFAFAAFTDQAKPVYMPYLVAEMLAKKQKTGLWAAPEMPYPNAILLSTIGGTSRRAPQ